MIDTIEDVLYPLRLIIFIAGYGIYKDRLGHSKYRLSLLYIFILWTIYACLFNYILIFFIPKQVFPRFMHCFMVMINLFVTFTSIIITIRDYEKFEICIRRLNLVDDTLEKFGLSKEYLKIYNSLKWILFIWLVTICATYTVDSLWCVEYLNDTKAMIIPLVADYSLHINTLMDIMFAFILRYIGARFDKINDYIIELSEGEECGLRCTWKRSVIVTRPCVRSTQNFRRILWIAMHLHSELCRIARDLNDLFGIQMTLQMMCYFVFVIGMISFQYHILLYRERKYYNILLKILLLSDVWSIIFLTKLILINHVCESVSCKAQKTKGVIHRLTNLTRFTEAREEICQFVLQVSLRPLKFSGMGLFYFGYNFIHKFFVQILTFIIIMAQMNTSTMYDIIAFDNIFNRTYKA